MAVWTAVVDLPVPPFSLAKTMKCGWPMACYSPCDTHNRPHKSGPWDRDTEGRNRMQIIRTLGELRPALPRWREAGQTIALVPTMGALHDGHLSLIGAGRANADRVLATIFVNPLQFNDKSDLARYPRDEAADVAKLRATG